MHQHESNETKVQTYCSRLGNNTPDAKLDQTLQSELILTTSLMASFFAIKHLWWLTSMSLVPYSWSDSLNKRNVLCPEIPLKTQAR